MDLLDAQTTLLRAVLERSLDELILAI